MRVILFDIGECPEMADRRITRDRGDCPLLEHASIQWHEVCDDDPSCDAILNQGREIDVSVRFAVNM